MAKTVYSHTAIVTLLATIRANFSALGVNVSQFSVVSTGTENRFSLVRRGFDGTDIATEVSGGMLKRLTETLFNAENLGLLVGSQPNSTQALAFAEHLAEKESAEAARIAEERAAREAELEEAATRAAVLEGTPEIPGLAATAGCDHDPSSFVVHDRPIGRRSPDADRQRWWQVPACRFAAPHRPILFLDL